MKENAQDFITILRITQLWVAFTIIFIMNILCCCFEWLQLFLFSTFYSCVWFMSCHTTWKGIW